MNEFTDPERQWSVGTGKGEEADMHGVLIRGGVDSKYLACREGQRGGRGEAQRSGGFVQKAYRLKKVEAAGVM